MIENSPLLICGLRRFAQCFYFRFLEKMSRRKDTLRSLEVAIGLAHCKSTALQWTRLGPAYFRARETLNGSGRVAGLNRKAEITILRVRIVGEISDNTIFCFSGTFEILFLNIIEKRWSWWVTCRKSARRNLKKMIAKIVTDIFFYNADLWQVL